jgi:hypothetical protein
LEGLDIFKYRSYGTRFAIKLMRLYSTPAIKTFKNTWFVASANDHGKLRKWIDGASGQSENISFGKSNGELSLIDSENDWRTLLSAVPGQIVADAKVQSGSTVTFAADSGTAH